MTSSTYNPPSIDPADEDSLTGAFRFILNKMLQSVDGMLPARVIAYDRIANRARVQPLIALVTTGGDKISRAQIASVPVLQLGGGGSFLSFNLVEGDLGWILANDRDISIFLQSYEESTPNTNRKNQFSDSLFMPDIMKGYTINSEDDANAVLSSIDGKVRIALWPDRVKTTVGDGTHTATLTLTSTLAHIVALNGLQVDGPLSATDGISITGGSGISITGDFTMTGLMHVSGDISASGTITPGVPP
jgi:hypothetical protein